MVPPYQTAGYYAGVENEIVSIIIIIFVLKERYIRIWYDFLHDDIELLGMNRWEKSPPKKKRKG